MNLFTDKRLLKDIDFSFSIKELVKDMLKDPAVPYRKEAEIPFYRRYGVQEKIVTEGLQEGQVKHWISTVSIDTYGEVMLPKGAQLKYYKKNPMVLWGHDYREPENVMGTNLEIEAVDTGLMALTQFALSEEKAARVYRLYKGKHLRMWSVGFIPIKGMKPEPKKPKKDVDFEKLYEWLPNPEEVQWIHQKWRLLEYSAVPVGANPDALTIAVKSIGGPDDMVEECKSFEECLLKQIEESKTIIDLGGLSKDDPKEEERKKEEAEKKKSEAAKELIDKGIIESVEELNEIIKSGEGGVFAVSEESVEALIEFVKNIKGEEDFEYDPDEEGLEWDSGEGVDPETFKKEYEEGKKIDDDEVTKPLPNTHSCRLVDPEKFKKGSFKSYSRTAGNGKEYRVIAGRLKGKTKMTEQSFRYTKDTWSASEAKKHCTDHKGIKFEPATGKSMENIEIKDLKEMWEKMMPPDSKDAENLKITYEFWEAIISELKELRELIEVKEGRVLSGKNRQIVTDAVSAMKKATEKLEELLEATEPKEVEEQSEAEVKEEKPEVVMELGGWKKEFKEGEPLIVEDKEDEVVLTVTEKKEDMKDKLDIGKLFKKALDKTQGEVR